MSTIRFSVQGKAYNTTKTEVKARRFNIIIDEPKELGGEDDAPNPVEYLLAGYAGCINVVTHIIAKEKNITIHDLRINIQGDINPLRLLGQSFDVRAGFQSLQVEIAIEANASQEDINRLIDEVKQRCPVNDNLSNETPISYLLKQPLILN
ncbi:MAG: OsmC family protein [Flavobacteriales bacterium]|nr:OsmC family protein [Flavobacteriales bacterium]